MLDHLRQVIGWRGMAQRDPLNEYKSEAFELFDALITRLREMVTAQLMRVEVAYERAAETATAADAGLAFRSADRRGRTGPCPDQRPHRRRRIHAARARRARRAGASAATPTIPKSWGRVGRNEPCPCGSGKKYKHCHGVVA